MSFDVTIQFNASDPQHLDKEITDLHTFTGALREECSIENPEILLNCDLADLIGANYFTVSTFGRSYYITSAPVLVRTGLCRISGHTDVLSSFKTQIRAQTAIIKRQETSSGYNLLINDGSLRTYQDPYILTEPFPAGFSGYSYAMMVAGHRSSTP